MYRPALIVFTIFASLVAFGAQSASAASVTNDALGDSVAAGLGLPSVPNPTPADITCGRSSQSYSALATAQAGVVNNNFSCSGATAANVTSQIAAAQAYANPNYVTLTVGANDTGWGQWIQDCMASSDCGEPATQTAFNSALATFEVNLKQNLTAIVAGLSPQQILVTGYYPLFGNDSSCAAPYGITSQGATIIDGRLASVSSAIASVVATVPQATFVPISFNGQGICTPNGPIQPASSSTYGHPTLSGQQIIANAVLAEVQ